MKPPIPYFGSKSTLAPWIVSLLPEHEHYVEPFAGSLAVLLAKAPSRHETVNDRSRVLMTFWRVLRDRPDELVRACALTPHSRAEFDAAWQDTDDELELARRVWVRLTQSRGGSLRKTGWRHYLEPASATAMPGYLDAYRDRLAAGAQRLLRVSLECRPALEVIAAYGSRPGCLLYVDPPYPGDLRTHSNRYEHEMRAEGEHRDLAEALHACTGAVVLSGYPSPLYDQLYHGWHREQTTVSTGNARRDKQQRVEVLWSNRPLSTQMALTLEPAA